MPLRLDRDDIYEVYFRYYTYGYISSIGVEAKQKMQLRTQEMKMPQLTIEQRKLIVEEMILTKSTTSTRRKFKKLNGYSPSKRTIQQLFLKWRKECTLHNLNKGRSGHPVTHRNPVNINHVESLILENDTKSTRKLASETGLSRTTMQKILKKDLGLKSFTAKVTQQLSESV